MLESLDAPWREVLLLGWEAYAAGSIPVGAVVVDGDGLVLARGRNRIFDGPHDVQLAGSRLAHAEINALAQLPAPGTYEFAPPFAVRAPQGRDRPTSVTALRAARDLVLACL